jgi:hypothetical protein
MLLLSNIGGLITGYSLIMLFQEHHFTTVNVVLLGTSAALEHGMFSLSHFLLAEKYRRMARRVPEVLDGKPETPQTMLSKAVYWVLLAANIILPIC